MAAISVIVPVYNVEEYLEWCLDSLKSQTLKDIEIICVNDGSTDSSREILDKCQKQDSRITIVDKPNGGLSSARNAGIRAATSDIVCFLDSDDRFTPDACEVITDAFKKTNADVVTFGANCFPENAGYPWLIEHLSPRDVVYEPFHPDLLFKEMSRPFAWRTACKKSFLVQNNIAFTEDLKFGEDQVFHFAVYPRAKKTTLISNKLYDYRVSRKGSLMDKVTHDLYLKCSEHIKITKCIFEDWKNGGYLATYSNELAEWLVDFVLKEALGLTPEQAKDIFGSLGKVWQSFQDLPDISNLYISPATKQVFELMFRTSKITSIRLKTCQLLYFKQQYGTKALLHKIL